MTQLSDHHRLQCAAALNLPEQSPELRNVLQLWNAAQSSSTRTSRRAIKRRLMSDYRTTFFPPGFAGWLGWLAVRFVVSRILDWLLDHSSSQQFANSKRSVRLMTDR
jgi:hypothetical protein